MGEERRADVFRYEVKLKGMQMMFYDPHELANCIECIALHQKRQDDLDIRISIIFEKEKKDENAE